jgi:hypothetical protein
VPRGESYRSNIVSFASGQSDPLEVIAGSSPDWAFFIEKLRFEESSVSTSTSGGTGTGLVQIEYPDYVGQNTNTYVIGSTTELLHEADQVVSHNSATYYEIQFKPPILLKASNDGYNTLTVGLPTNVVVDTGYLNVLATGWKIKEDDY